MLPVGTVTPTGYELYCETPEEPDVAAAPPAGRSVGRSIVAKFREMLAAAERERRAGGAHRHSAHHEHERRRWTRRTRDRAMRWVAEAIAEQRLLWHLRRQTQATLVHPADLPPQDARRVLDTTLQRDADRHRWWLVVDSLGLLASAALIIIPGPNVILYYFAFRVVGHYLSWGGARNGLNGVDWREQPSTELAELRQIPSLDEPAREVLVQSVAAALGLEHLPAFFERLAVS